MLKCLELSASEHDNEALLAVRKANELRQALGIMWSDLMLKPATVTKAGDDPDEFDYAEIFRTIFDHGKLSDKWEEILRNVETYWLSVGQLSPKQHNLVMKFYRTATGGTP
jgi:hypothetical protein